MRWTKDSFARRIPNALIGIGFLSVVVASRVIGEARAQARHPRPPAVASRTRPARRLRTPPAESWTSCAFSRSTTERPACARSQAPSACKDCHKS
jgi:hypothetical protein